MLLRGLPSAWVAQRQACPHVFGNLTRCAAARTPTDDVSLPRQFSSSEPSSGAVQRRPRATTSERDGRPMPAPAAAQQDEDILPHRRRAAARKAETAAFAPVQSPWQQPPSRQPSGSASTTAASGRPAGQATGQQGEPSSSPPSPAPAGEVPYDTFVPRNPGVTDGPWNPVDVTVLETAFTDAELAVTPKKIDESGYVLLGKSLAEIEALVVQHKQPKYRAKQIMDAVLQGARSLDQIATIPKELRAALTASGVRTGRSILHKVVSAPDGTRKFLLQLHDGRVVETVGIPNDDEPTTRDSSVPGTAGAGEGARRRLTVCVSSQVGCPMRCSFCATGKGGFFRNLMPHEIMDQVVTVQEQFGARVSNVVFMGMGEPLLNVPSVTAAYHLLNEQMGIGGRCITISTVGVPNAIARLAKAELKSTLAVSIHAPTQQLRESIIPSAKAYPIQELMKDCTKYYRTTGRRVTFEYTLLSGVNDATEHAQQLADLLRSHNLMSHVNLIPWNPVDESEFIRPSGNRIFNFVRTLEAAGLTATVRVTRGLEAAAACGQLRNMYQKEPLPAFAVPA